MEDVLQKGINQVAAGYIIYGSSTMLVFTTGQGVNAFTLDSSIGDFCGIKMQPTQTWKHTLILWTLLAFM